MSTVQRQAPRYYEGLWPPPGTEMLVTSVSTVSGGNIHPKMYLRWENVQVPFQVEKAIGDWLLVDFVSEIPGCTVTVDIDDTEDTAIIVAQKRSAPPALVKQKTLVGKLGWALQIQNPRKCAQNALSAQELGAQTV